MRVVIDPLLCQGHAQCVLNLPELFALDELESHGYVLLDPVPDELAEQARWIVGGCPERAISLTDSAPVRPHARPESAEGVESAKEGR